MAFNDVPGHDGSDGGMKRRLRLTHFRKKAVEIELRDLGENEVKLDNTIYKRFDTKEYGAICLAYLIKTFNTSSFVFPTPPEVNVSTDDYNRENDLVGEFTARFYEMTNDDADKISLSDMWKD